MPSSSGFRNHEDIVNDIGLSIPENTRLVSGAQHRYKTSKTPMCRFCGDFIETVWDIVSG